jgi:hypothetical protein
MTMNDAVSAEDIPAVKDNEWVKVSQEKPPLHVQVLIKWRESIGDVCDVACYLGKTPDGDDRWICADVSVDTRQILEWAHIFPLPPANLLKEAYNAGIQEGLRQALESTPLN